VPTTDVQPVPQVSRSESPGVAYGALNEELVRRLDTLESAEYRSSAESFVDISRQDWLLLLALYVVLPALLCLAAFAL
jgi:hypothetical protein